jgi:hypothetical protein
MLVPTAAMSIDREALRAGTARSATSGCGPTATSSTSRSPVFEHYVEDPYVEPRRARAAVRRGHRRVHRRRVRRPDHRRQAEGGRHRRRAHHREGRRLRRHLVLEPLPGRPVRHRGVRLPAAARGDRAHARARSTPTPPRSSSTAAASAATSTCTTTPVLDRGHRSTGTTTRRWIIRTDRGDEMRAKFVAMGTGPLHRPKLPGIPASRPSGPQLPHQPLGLRLHRRRPVGRPLDRPAPTSASASSAPAPPPCSASPPRPRREGAVRVPAHAVVDRRAQQPPIDPDWFRTLEPGWQAKWLMNFTTLQTGGFADEDLVKDGWTDIAQRIRDKVMASGEEFTRETFIKAYEDSDDEKMTEIRARVDALVADRRPPRRSSPGTASCASGRASTTSTSTPTTSPARTWSTPTARASSASTRPGCGPTASTTSSTASSTRRGSRWAPSSPAAPASRPSAVTASAVGSLGRGHAVAARHPRARLPEPVHRRAVPRCGLISNVPTTTSRPAPRSRRHRPRAHPRRRRRRGRGHRRGRTGLGRRLEGAGPG